MSMAPSLASPGPLFVSFPLSATGASVLAVPDPLPLPLPLPLSPSSEPQATATNATATSPISHLRMPVLRSRDRKGLRQELDGDVPCRRSCRRVVEHGRPVVVEGMAGAGL